ncbi:MAG: spike base protein, RCAP_Rcc01079 family [Pseudooceanicola nanhaiensis]
MPESYSTHAGGLTSPAADAAAILPDDGQDLPEPTRAIYVGGAGSLRVQMIWGATVDLAAVSAGMIYPLRVRRVMATGTSATGLVALR